MLPDATQCDTKALHTRLSSASTASDVSCCYPMLARSDLLLISGSKVRILAHPPLFRLYNFRFCDVTQGARNVSSNHQVSTARSFVTTKVRASGKQ